MLVFGKCDIFQLNTVVRIEIMSEAVWNDYMSGNNDNRLDSLHVPRCHGEEDRPWHFQNMRHLGYSIPDSICFSGTWDSNQIIFIQKHLIWNSWLGF